MKEFAFGTEPPGSGRICIVGAGFMGCVIATLSAHHGYDAVICDSCHCTLINQNLQVQGILGHFCTLNYNISTGCSLQDLTPLERVQIASARASNA